MPDSFNDSEANKESNWSAPPESVKNEEFIRAFYQQPPPDQEDQQQHQHQHQHSHHHQQFEPGMYQPPAEHFDMDYPFSNQGYFVPPVEGEFAPPTSTTSTSSSSASYPRNTYKVTKNSNGGSLRHMASRRNLYIPPHNFYVPPTATPPGSAGVPGPMSVAPFAQDMQWQEVNTDPSISPPIPAATKSSRSSRSRLARDTQGGPVARAKFSMEEDAKILKLRFTDGLGWSVIASNYMPHRSEKGLQVHYSVSLKDQVESYNREWTPEEDQELLRLVSEHQRAMWGVISKRFGEGNVGATACFVRHRFLMRRDEDELEASVQAYKQANRS